VEGTAVNSAGVPGATWYEHDYCDHDATTQNDWTTAGGDFGTTVLDTQSITEGQWTSLDITETVQAMYAYGHVVPNNATNMAAREKRGLPANPATVHAYPEFLVGIQKILDHFGMKEKSDRLLGEVE